MARKKLVVMSGGRSAHRSCRPSAGGPRVASTPGAARAATAVVKQQKQKPMSRTELLKRIQELRARDAKKKPAAAKDRSAARLQPKSTQPKSKTKAPTKAKAKAKAVPRANAAATHRTTTPPPYYGVEMKCIDGRWVQMHPESE
ncbi:hypothetical protein [Streptomyces virginiae]|uniref:hypothetical protein n=1 Tax=Streptomyces virginiae TaxID=1961 RepID=UPI00344045F4